MGGLLIGYLGANVLGRKRVLLLSFAGAGLSYLLVGVADSLGLLVLSRVIVGLVKQTMTTSTALVTQLSDSAGRTALCLPHISPHLPHISPTGHPAERQRRAHRPLSPPYLPTSPPHLPYRSPS